MASLPVNVFVFVLSTPPMGVWVLVIDYSYSFLGLFSQMLESCCTSILPGFFAEPPFKYELLSRTGTRQFQFICGRCTGVSALPVLQVQLVNSNPTPEVIEVLIPDGLKKGWGGLVFCICQCEQPD